MSWAMKRRVLYLLGVFLFFGIIISIPTAIILHKPPTCEDGLQNQGEHSADRGGPCTLLDGRFVIPYASLWSRAFQVRDGMYNAVAYIENPNGAAGIQEVEYHMRLYDDENVLVEERKGTTFIMPGGITPVYEGGIVTGSRKVTHTIFELGPTPTWIRMRNVTDDVEIIRSPITEVSTVPRLTAKVTNKSVRDITGLTFVVVIYDPAGNAFASSQTAVPRLNAAEQKEITFTWPVPFTITVGRIDITALHMPEVTPLKVQQ